jgi:hypothetical protein
MSKEAPTCGKGYGGCRLEAGGASPSLNWLRCASLWLIKNAGRRRNESNGRYAFRL